MDAARLPCRVSILQPALPAYRIPLFKALAGSDAIDLRVFFESVEGLANSPAIGFAAENVARRDLYLGGLVSPLVELPGPSGQPAAIECSGPPLEHPLPEPGPRVPPGPSGWRADRPLGSWLLEGESAQAAAA